MQKASRLAIIIIVSILLPVLPFIIVGELPGERWLSQSDDNALKFAVTGSSLLAADILLPVPSSIIGTALGARLGFVGGMTWCWIGLTLGNVIGYLVGQLFPKRFASELAQTPTQAIVFLSRPVPVIAEAVVIAAGANRLDWRAFLMPCMLGNAVYSCVLCANAAFWLPASWRGPGLVLPLLLPVAVWMLWHRGSRQSPD